MAHVRNLYHSDRIFMKGSGGAHGLYANRGAGIGSIFSSLYSSVVPIVKSIVKTGLKTGASIAKSPVGKAVAESAKRSAAKAGLGLVGDALEGKNVISATKKRVKQAVNEVSSDLQKRGSRALKAAAAPINRPKKKNKKKKAAPSRLKAVRYKTKRKPDLFYK